VADRSPDYAQAFLIHDQRFNEDTLNAKGAGATGAAYTQGGVKQGVPLASGSERMIVEASGTQSEDGEIVFTTQRAGLPIAGGATYVFQDVGAADTSSQQFGHEGWSTVTGYASLLDSNGTPTNSNMTPHAITLASGNLFAVIENIETGVGSPFLNMRHFSPTAGWTTITHTHSGATNQLGCAVVELPDGSILCFIEARGGDQIDVLRSTDEGTTWATAAERVLDIAVNTADIRRIGAAYNGGQVLLLVSFHDGANFTLAQYASYDRGATFRQIEDDFRAKHTDTKEPSNASAIGMRGGGFLVAYTDTRNGETHRVGRLGDAAQNAATMNDVNVAPYASADAASLAIFEDNDAEVWALCHDNTSGHGDLTLLRSVDGGFEFEGVQYSGNRPVLYSSVGGAAEFKHYTAALSGGRLMIIGKFTGSGNANDDHSTVVIYAGGHARHTVPAADSSDSFGPTDWLAWGEGGGGTSASLWLPFTQPDNLTGWTVTGVGTYTSSSISGLLTTAANTLIFEHDWENTHAAQVCEFALDIESGGSTSTDVISVEVAISDGTSGGAGTYTYIVSIRMTTTGWRLYDVNAAANAAATVTKSLLTKRHFRVAMDNAGNCTIWTAADDHQREWIENVAVTGLTNTAAAHGNRLRFGHRANGTAVSDWYMAGVSYSGVGKFTPSSSVSVAASWTNPDDLRGREFSATPELVTDGIRLSAAGGPAWKGDAWTVTADYAYPIEHALTNVAPSPAEFYRGTADNVEVLLPFDIEPDFTNAQTIGDNFGVFFFNTNVREFAIQTYNGSAWATIATAYAYTDFDALDYVSTGRIVGVDTGASQTGARFFWRMAHAGDTFDFQDGTPTLRKIEANTPGAWTDSTTVRPEIKIEGADGTEPASGTGRVWRRDFGIVYAAAISTQQMRIRIPAHETADGYYQIGTMIMGPLVMFGKPTDRGWTRELRPNVDVETRRDGVRRVQKDGDMRQAIEIAWAEGFDDLSALQMDDPVPDWVGNNGTPSASHRGTTRDVLGTVRLLGGALHPCVYLGRVDKLSGASSQAFTMPDSYWYGRIASKSLRVETLYGTESLSEAGRLNTVSFEEEL
jgi:hypothetical protein